MLWLQTIMSIEFCRFLERRTCPPLHIHFLVPPRETPWSLSCLLKVPTLDMIKAIKLGLLVAGFHLCSAYLLPNDSLYGDSLVHLQFCFLCCCENNHMIYPWSIVLCCCSCESDHENSQCAYVKLQFCGCSLASFLCIYLRIFQWSVNGDCQICVHLVLLLSQGDYKRLV